MSYFPLYVFIGLFVYAQDNLRSYVDFGQIFRADWLWAKD